MPRSGHWLTVAVGALAAATLAACAAAPAVDASATPLPTRSVAEGLPPAVTPSATAEPAGGPSSEVARDASPTPTASAASLDLDEQAEEMAEEIADLINASREDDDEDALTWSDCAADQAGERVERALERDDLAYERVVIECTGSIAGENLARGDGPAQNLYDIWTDSKSHRENILRGEFERVGVACVAHARGDRTEPAADADDIGGWACSAMFYG